MYPSSKTCSVCGVVNHELKRQPAWKCPGCGQDHDRNMNAACNLLKLALLAVGEDVMLPDGEALADGHSTNGETAAIENLMKSDTPVLLVYRLQVLIHLTLHRPPPARGGSYTVSTS